MLTKFGKLVRRLRLDNDINLQKLAEGIGTTSAYLSAVEYGKKNATSNLVEGIALFLELNETQIRELETAAYVSKSSQKLNLTDQSQFDRETAAELARRVNSSEFNEKEWNKLRELLCSA